MIKKWRIEKDVEGNGRVPIELVSGKFSRETEENYKNLSRGIRNEHLSNNV
jgi:hypothetical protein